MSAYKRVNYTEVEPVSGAMHPLSESLDTERIGITIVRCKPRWQSKPHDHRENDHEEIYVLVDGTATVVVEDESVPMESGDAIRIMPEATRQIQNGSKESVFVLVSASECTRPIEDDSSYVLDGFQG